MAVRSQCDRYAIQRESKRENEESERERELVTASPFQAWEVSEDLAIAGCDNSDRAPESLIEVSK